MNNLESISLTYKYLSEVYNLTKSDYISKKMIKSGELRGLNIKSLIKYNLLTEQNDKIKWKGLTLQYFHAYDYYNAVRGKKKTYEYLLSILKNPENYDLNEIMEALAIKDACTVHGLENSEIITTYENKVINIDDFNIHEAISTPEISLIEKIKIPEIQISEKVLPDLNYELLKTISNKFDLFLADNSLIKELLSDIVENAMENTTSIRNNHNSISTIIAILKTNQDNLFDISASQYYIIRELYANLIEMHSNTDDPKIIERIDKLSVAMQQMRKRVDNNTILVNKYGNGKH